MARKLRVQFEGAVYHIINRGNYRHEVFTSAATAQAFERCLFEVCERMGWRLHAFVIMRNHYHLAVETPRANLTEGMHWLQGTFATRFNRFRGERGHLFQGRYQAILVEPGAALARVVDYIHLNPARAGLVEADQIAAFRWGSLRRFMKGPRLAFMVCADWLATRGLTDDAAGWRNYAAHLRSVASGAGEPAAEEVDGLSRGWAIGTPVWRETLAKEHAHRALTQPVGPEAREIKEAHWSQALNLLLEREGRTREQAAEDWKGVPWKIAIAQNLRQTTTATNRWIARELNMGSPSSVSQYLSLVRAGKIKILEA